MGISTPLDFTTYCGETVKQQVPKPASANASKVYHCHSVCAACQQHWTWFAQHYRLEVNVFRSHLGNPSVLPCVHFIGSPICPRHRKSNAINLISNNSQLINSYQVSSSSAPPCPGRDTYSCLINEMKLEPKRYNACKFFLQSIIRMIISLEK